jgi:predicted acylesterase/phospholipase RssA/CRP-like cAMP-binding protein
MVPDQERLCAELRRLEWARQLNEEVVQEIASSAEFVQFQVGQIVIELDSEIDHVYFVISGRLEGVLFDRLGKVLRRDILWRGSVVGLFSVLLPDRSHLQVEALEPTTVVRLTLDELLRLAGKHREFQLTMFRVSANIVKQLVLVDRELPKPAVVGLFHHSPASRPLARQLVQRLRELDESPCVTGDDERFRPDNGLPYKLLFENGKFVGPEEMKQLLKEWAAHGRLLLDLRADHSSDDLTRLINYSDIVLWCLEPRDVDAAVRTLKALQQSSPRLREKVRIVWILSHDESAPPHVPELCELSARDFKIFSGQPKPNQGKLLKQGVEQIIHHLRGVQIGLALGGGAARGMAHLGVLKALQQHGIYVDMLAGTSAGAMTGTIYASGMDPEYTTQCFKKDLLPSWFFRQLPGSGYWYLLYKYRRNQFEPMLRKYLDKLHMEQLLIPTFTIAVDLVDGIPLVRDTGDAVHNILESINLPPLSLPIIRAEQAVVDGGLLNNVPANVLVAKGCNFVIASTVSAKIEKDFLGIRSKKTRGVSKFFSTIQVIMRQNMIQSYSMNSVGVEPADFVIAPDVTAFDLSEFTRADEMAVIGENATNASVSQLKSMLSKLDTKLFT